MGNWEMSTQSLLQNKNKVIQVTTKNFTQLL